MLSIFGCHPHTDDGQIEAGNYMAEGGSVKSKK